MLRKSLNFLSRCVPVRNAAFIHTGGLLIECNGLVRLIGINSPSKKNSLSINIIQQLKQAFIDFDNSNAKVAVLHGERGNFCSGFDIDEVVNKKYDLFEKETEEWREGPLCKKPVVCAIDGYAVAEGFELALACDLRVIEITAVVGFFGRRYGMPMALGGGKRLAGLIGQSRALDLVITGRPITGTAANEFGLASRLVATGAAIGQAISLAGSIAKFPPHAIEYDRFNTMKTSWNNFAVRNGYDEKYIDNLKNSALKDGELYLPKFIQGIGRHGNTKNIVVKKLKSWEYDNDVDVHVEDRKNEDKVS